MTGQLKWGQPPIVPSVNVFKTCAHVFFPVFLSLFSLCCYCFLRIYTLNKGCSVQMWKLTRFSSFNLEIFPILVEILHFGKDKAFYLSSLLSRKHFSVSALNSTYNDKLLFKCSGREECREMCQSVPLAMLREGFFSCSEWVEIIW